MRCRSSIASEGCSTTSPSATSIASSRLPAGRAAADRRAVGRVRRELSGRRSRARARRVGHERLAARRAAGEWPEARPVRAVPRLAPSTRRRASADLFVEHAVLPHQPFAFLPSGREYRAVRRPEALDERPDEGAAGARRRCSSTRRSSATCCRSDTSTRSSGRCCDRLKAVGLYDRALVVVAADHGISFGPAGLTGVVTKAEHRGHRRRPALRQVPGAAAAGPSTGAPPRRSTSSRRSPT